jgi:D-alanyl-D-alanine carboxypeptidase (penicillin-binding protein 5/6)
MKQRAILITIFLLMIVLFVVLSAYFSSAFSIGPLPTVFEPAPTSTPTAVPTATPTPEPTPTPIPSPTPTPLFYGSEAYLLDATTGKVLLDSNSHKRVAMWSTTKVMTALLTLKTLSPDLEVKITQDEIDEVPNGMSIAFLKPDDTMTVRDLLYGLLLPSGSDAAIVLAHTVAGNTDAFVAEMNNEAAALGMTDTHYTNPAGAADPNHYSSAADLVKVAQAAMGFTLFAQIVSTPTFLLGATQYHHKYPWDNIIASFLANNPGANGIKTGSDLSNTDWCMVFSSYNKGHLLIGAEMQAPSYDQIATDASQILLRGFASL